MEALFGNVLNIQWQQVVMWAIGGLLIWLAIKKEMEPTLLLPMGFGAILVNLPLPGVVGDENMTGIVKWLFELNAKQREVLARRFGLLGYEAATLEDVGREIGLTRERVRQIQVEGLRRLREILQTQGLNIEALFRE